MYWRLKAGLQNAVSLLPSSASYAAYYWLQRHFGGLRRVDPMSKLAMGVDTWKRIQKQGRNPSAKVFFEVGTGRIPIIPMAYWMMGADHTISIDLNPYVKVELVADSLDYMAKHEEAVRDLFGPLLNEGRFAALLELGRKPQFSLATFLELCCINYMAPGDAAHCSVPPASVDFHTSHNVCEHIPQDTVRQIMDEGNRVVRDVGLFIHRIDYSDHFSYSDPRISAINFLQFSDEKWHAYAGNRYMYMNRLRHDDFIALLESAGHTIVAVDPEVDKRSEALLNSGRFHLDERFRSKRPEILAITRSWVISQKAAN